MQESRITTIKHKKYLLLPTELFLWYIRPANSPLIGWSMEIGALLYCCRPLLAADWHAVGARLRLLLLLLPFCACVVEDFKQQWGRIAKKTLATYNTHTQQSRGADGRYTGRREEKSCSTVPRYDTTSVRVRRQAQNRTAAELAI